MIRAHEPPRNVRTGSIDDAWLNAIAGVEAHLAHDTDGLAALLGEGTWNGNYLFHLTGAITHIAFRLADQHPDEARELLDELRSRVLNPS